MKSGRVATSDQKKQRNHNTNKPTISTRLPFTLIAQSNKSCKLILGISPIKKIDFDIDPVNYKKTSFISFDFENYVNNKYKNTHLDFYNEQKTIKIKKKDKNITQLAPICSLDKVFQKHKVLFFLILKLLKFFNKLLLNLVI